MAQLWRALSRSRLADAIAEGLLVLQRTLDRRREQDEGDAGGDGGRGGEDGGVGGRDRVGGAGSHLAAAVRQAHMDQMQLREAAQLAFGVRADRPTLSRSLAWMPPKMELPYGWLYKITHGCPYEFLTSGGCQLSLAAGVVAAVCAAGVGRSTYGLAPGPLVALVGDVLPCLWECGEGREGAEGSGKRLVGLVRRRLGVLCAVIEKKSPLPFRLGGLEDACRRLVAALVARTGDQTVPCDPDRQLQQEQQQQQQQEQKQQRWPVGRAAGQQVAAGPSDPWSGTWLAGVCRHDAIDLAARTLDALSSIARALVVQRGRGHGVGGSNDLPLWRPLWWWRHAVQLLPLLTEGEQGQGQQQPSEWRPIGSRHRGMFSICDNEPKDIMGEGCAGTGVTCDLWHGGHAALGLHHNRPPSQELMVDFPDCHLRCHGAHPFEQQRSSSHTIIRPPPLLACRPPDPACAA